MLEWGFAVGCGGEFLFCATHCSVAVRLMDDGKLLTGAGKLHAGGGTLLTGGGTPLTTGGKLLTGKLAYTGQ